MLIYLALKDGWMGEFYTTFAQLRAYQTESQHSYMRLRMIETTIQLNVSWADPQRGVRTPLSYAES